MNDDILTEMSHLHHVIMKVMSQGCDIKNTPSPTQTRIICYLINHQNNDVYQKDLENHLSLSRATLSNVLNTMEKKKIVTRIISKKDSRSKQIILNKEAIKKHNEAMKKLIVINNTMISNISKKDLELFSNILEQMRNNLLESKTTNKGDDKHV